MHFPLALSFALVLFAALPAPDGRAPSRPAAWLPDPSGRHEARWWDGQTWTDAVLDAGRLSHDAIH